MCTVVQTCGGRDPKAAILQHRFCVNILVKCQRAPFSKIPESAYGDEHNAVARRHKPKASVTLPRITSTACRICSQMDREAQPVGICSQRSL